MEKVSRSIFYKERESILFFLGEDKSLERDFNNKLWERPFWGELKNGADDTLRLFNNACYICTHVFYDDYPPNELKEYEKIAIDGHDDPVWINHMFPATMALVVNWLSSEECRKISEGKGRVEAIEELCKRIHVSVEKRREGKEDFHTLIMHGHQLPSGFIKDGCFQRILLTEAIKDPTVPPMDIINSLGYLLEVIKYNPEEWLAAVGPDSYLLKEVPKMHFDTEGNLRNMSELLNEKYKDDKCTQRFSSSIYKDNGSGFEIKKGDIIIAEDRKVDVIKILHAMCKIGLFQMKDGRKVSHKTLMGIFGEMLNEDFSQYSSNLSDSKLNTKEETFLKVFDDLRIEASKYYKKS
jgi:hypothetical protein